MSTTPFPELCAWLDWYRLMGVDEVIGAYSVDRLAPGRSYRGEAGAAAGTARPAPPEASVAGAGSPARRARAPGHLLQSPGSAVASAREIAAACHDLAALEAAAGAFDGCALRETALHCCFADGGPEAEVMLIGEAPGAEEDRLGRPFVGQSGKLLDRMLATIELPRNSVYITNVIYWRPPGNRSPTQAEIAACQPFLERQIELLKPKIIVFLGGIAARGLLGVKEGVSKLRGRLFVHTTADGTRIPAMITFHPAFLLRTPAQKRLAWRDLLSLKQRLEEVKRPH
ncbi:MAG TPA: uracil-DNA glycosylase [Geminicoccaceae bacterium]|nr:uracil-DNA glycosylase [Geminicoccaceae bacterium]